MRSTANGNRRCGKTTRSMSLIRVAVLALGLVFILAPPVPAAGSAPSPIGRVEGVVLAASTKRPVAGATISLPDYGIRTTSAGDGSFLFATPLPTDHPYRRVQAVVTAPGWGRWSIRGVPLYPGDTLKLRAELRAQDFDHRVLTPAERRATPQPKPPPSSYSSTCTGWKYKVVPPTTIKVWITDQSQSEQYDFVFYATHVLPNEWYPSWDPDSLGAGAIAVKTYGYYRAMAGHAYSGGANCADVVDGTGDQVFDPTWSSEYTDEAVYATLGSVLWQNGGLFLSHYFAGISGDPCAHVEGQYAGWMSQWGTQSCATQKPDGMLWPDIVTTFYDDTSWSYLSNLLLNPDVESAATYAWSWGDGTATRVTGGSYSANWHWQDVPTPGLKMSLREYRPVVGEVDTTYHAEAALRCGPENASSCSVSLWVVVFEANGNQHKKSTTVTVPNDGVWRLYTFDPAASGYAHDQVKTIVQSKQTIDVDATVLTSPYGGP